MCLHIWGRADDIPGFKSRGITLNRDVCTYNVWMLCVCTRARVCVCMYVCVCVLNFMSFLLGTPLDLIALSINKVLGFGEDAT